MTAEQDLGRYRASANKLRADISKASSTVAAKRRRATDARSAAARSSSPSMIRSKHAEAERATRDADAAERDRASLEKKLADVEVKATKAQQRVDKERHDSQARALAALERRTRAAAAQFDPPSWLPHPSGVRAVPVADGGMDVFLSHAREDKAEIARPLRIALETRGVSVYLDEVQIKVGQSIRREIDKGIARSRFGVVVVSPSFLSKQWTNAELDALFDRKMSTGGDTVLPIWHRVSKDEVAHASPLLAGILALNSSTMTIEEMADALATVVRPERGAVEAEAMPPDAGGRFLSVLARLPDGFADDVESIRDLVTEPDQPWLD